MQILNLTKEEAQRVRAAWLATDKHRPENERGVEVLDQVLTKEPNVHWFYGPTENTFIYVHRVSPLYCAFHAINSGGFEQWADRKRTQKIIKGIFHDLDILRLSAAVPAPLLNVRKFAEHIGFVYEGRMRRSGLFNGEPVDVILYGMLASEIDKLGKRKRRRRGRRKNRAPSYPIRVGTADAPAAAEDFGSEEPEKEA